MDPGDFHVLMSSPVHEPIVDEREYFEPERDPLWITFVVWILILGGLAPRLAQYFHYRALSYDEAVLAYNFVTRPWSELFGPFGDSMAPAGYLVLSRVAVILAGATEHVTRFLPFAGSVLTLALFYPVARRLVSPLGALLGLAFIAVAKHLIFFGDYVRPYSTDAAILIVLLGAAAYVQRDAISWLKGIFYAALGAVAVWLSFPAVFVLAGVATIELLFAVMQQPWRRVAKLAAIYAVWAASFLGMYFATIAPITDDDATMELMNDYNQYAQAFMPMPPTTYAEFKWFNWNFIRVFENPGGWTLPGLAAFTAVAGVLSLLAASRKRLAFLLAPIAVALVVSGFEKYPFWGRTILYLTPLLCMLVGEGAAHLMRKLQGRAVSLAVVLLIMLIGVPAFRAGRIVLSPSSHHELHVALDYARDRWKPNDLLYVHDSSIHAFYFAKQRYEFPENAVLEEPRIPPDDGSHRDFLNGRMPRLQEHDRVWIAVTYDLPSVVRPFVETLDDLGARLDEHHAQGASMYLYEFQPLEPL